MSTDVEYVMIHDSARPLITSDTIKEAHEILVNKGACVVGVPVKDTIKQVDEECKVTETLPRNTLWAAQTPQCFRKELITFAYNNMYKAIEEARKCGEEVLITDDAMIVEAYGDARVCMVQGEYTNIKITTPEDIELAKLYLKYV